MEQLAARKPIVYQTNVEIRFSEIDAYNHVNSKHYLDLVSTSRLNYLDRVMKFPIEKVLEKGLGFYLAMAQQFFKKPIVGLNTVHVTSFISKIDGAKLTIPYQILSEDKARLHSDGTLEFSVVDLKTGKPVKELPDWFLELFFEKEG